MRSDFSLNWYYCWKLPTQAFLYVLYPLGCQSLFSPFLGLLSSLCSSFIQASLNYTYKKSVPSHQEIVDLLDERAPLLPVPTLSNAAVSGAKTFTIISPTFAQTHSHPHPTQHPLTSALSHVLMVRHYVCRTLFLSPAPSTSRKITLITLTWKM